MSYSDATAQRGPGPPYSWGFYITHSDTPYLAGLLCTRDRPVTETSTWQHTTLTGDRRPFSLAGFFFLFSLVLYPYSFLCLDCPGLFLLSLLNNTHNTNIHAPGGIRILNPSKRYAADPHLRPLGHRDRQKLSQRKISRIPQRIEPVTFRFVA